VRLLLESAAALASILLTSRVARLRLSSPAAAASAIAMAGIGLLALGNAAPSLVDLVRERDAGADASAVDARTSRAQAEFAAWARRAMRPGDTFAVWPRGVGDWDYTRLTYELAPLRLAPSVHAARVLVLWGNGRGGTRLPRGFGPPEWFGPGKGIARRSGP
jgi:hypothetical protein